VSGPPESVALSATALAEVRRILNAEARRRLDLVLAEQAEEDEKAA
jgi:hypothetical protein